MIEPKYVTFEQAKWLKEKGFDEECKKYSRDGVGKPISGFVYQGIKAPEQWMVVEWLRVNHGVWIEVRHIKTFGINRFYIIIWKYGEEDYHTIHCGNGVGYEVWDTPQEAYSVAFDYIRLNNLI